MGLNRAAVVEASGKFGVLRQSRNSNAIAIKIASEVLHEQGIGLDDNAIGAAAEGPFQNVVAVVRNNTVLKCGNLRSAVYSDTFSIAEIGRINLLIGIQLCNVELLTHECCVCRIRIAQQESMADALHVILT